ncbi:hypothetical protein [Thalassospira sp. MIT1370]|uniref:hypothetical protein n=1 Tax=unclassified Thalassospira TaxID=2648997 RepID=UPI002E8616DB|nr:hypothetical protein [Pseudomonadota bacterium]
MTRLTFKTWNKYDTQTKTTALGLLQVEMSYPPIAVGAEEKNTAPSLEITVKNISQMTLKDIAITYDVDDTLINWDVSFVQGRHDLTKVDSPVTVQIGTLLAGDQSSVVKQYWDGFSLDGNPLSKSGTYAFNASVTYTVTESVQCTGTANP